ncbi:MAG: GIY-YIG nuclease family protein [Chitinophagaceae bacterium]|nr:GIY-YIG nuclease family protein [Chitinophagaceae bacterium]
MPQNLCRDFLSPFVYILQSLKDGKYYIGETHDVEARLLFHNSGKQRSTKTEFLQ